MTEIFIVLVAILVIYWTHRTIQASTKEAFDRAFARCTSGEAFRGGTPNRAEHTDNCEDGDECPFCNIEQ